MAVFVDLLVIMFMIGLTVNYSILLLSVVRLFKFIRKNKYARAFFFLAIAIISIIYINLGLQMLMFYWGSVTSDIEIYLGQLYIDF